MAHGPWPLALWQVIFLSDSKPTRSTYDRALDMLEARARGVAELRRLLIRKGEPEGAVDAAIERLRASGLLDDANYARQLTRSGMSAMPVTFTSRAHSSSSRHVIATKPPSAVA